MWAMRECAGQRRAQAEGGEAGGGGGYEGALGQDGASETATTARGMGRAVVRSS